MSSAQAEKEQHVNVALARTVTVLRALVYPIGFIVWYGAIAVLTILKLLHRPLAFLLAPFVYLTRFLLACLALPFRVAAKFETLYIYLGVAALVGVIGGLIVGIIYLWLHKLLRLDPTAPKPKPKGRTVRQYREEKRQQKLKVEAPAISPNGYVSPNLLSPPPLSPTYLSLSDGMRPGRRRGLLAQTIMEEDDSDF